MSKLAMHIQHQKRGQVGNIDRHNRRIDESHSNEDIDVSRSAWNINVVSPGSPLWTALQPKIENVKANGGRVTANSVVCSEWIVYPPENLQNPFTADRGQLKAWSNDVIEWMRSKGINPEQAIIHMDETTVHMHVDSMPLTADGRLSRKEIYTRAALREFHTELSDHLSSRGWDIQRGESTKGKNVKSKSIKEYKQEQEKKVADLEHRAEQLTDALKSPLELERINVKVSALGNSVKLSKDDYDVLRSYADACAVSRLDADRYKKLYETEHETVEEYKAKASLSFAERMELFELRETLSKVNDRLEQMEKQVKLVDKLIMHLPSFIADKLRLRELEKTTGFKFDDYYSFKKSMAEMQERVSSLNTLVR